MVSFSGERVCPVERVCTRVRVFVDNWSNYGKNADNNATNNPIGLKVPAGLSRK